MKKMMPVYGKIVREELSLRRSQVAREAGMQPGVIAWIEEGRFVPYCSQLEKIAEVYRSHGWNGAAEDLLEEVN